MKKLFLLTKTLLAVALLCVGQNAWGATETYDFSNYVVTENLGYSTGRDLTLTGDNIATADASTVKLVSGVSSGTSFDFGGRFAVQGTTVKFRNGNSQSKATTYKVNKGIQYASGSGTNHFSILNLRENDIVTITTGSGTTKFASTNAKVGGSQVTYNQRVGSDATTGDVGSTTVCTMMEDGNLDLIMEGWAVIMSVTINNDTYSVKNGDDLDDGATVNDVYGITMTYHGDWTYENNSSRGGDLAYGTYPTGSTNNLPNDNMYLIFTPHVTGQLQANVNIYGSHGTWYLVDKDNGHIFSTKSSKSNDYTNLKDFGTIVKGHTYYLYGLGCDWGYQFHSFKFTPKDNDITSYVVNTAEIVNVGSDIDYVPGITMTYGGAAESTWNTYNTYSHDNAENTGGNASLTDGIPTSGTFLKFTPSVNGILNVGYIGYSTSKTCNVILTDGVKTETISHAKGESNSYKNDTFKTILASGKTYYVYFSGGGFAAKFSDFSFEKIPSTVTATIGSNGYTTFASPYPLDLTAATQSANSFKAYRASAVNDETVTFKDDVNQTVVANTGVLLQGTANAVVTIPVVASGSALEENALQVNTAGTTFPVAANTTYYGMNKGSNPLTFGTFNPSSVAIPASKAYLALTSNAARSIRVVFGDITGVANVEAAAEVKAKEGKFIENGKLVIVKNGVKYNAAGQQVK